MKAMYLIMWAAMAALSACGAANSSDEPNSTAARFWADRLPPIVDAGKVTEATTKAPTPAELKYLADNGDFNHDEAVQMASAVADGPADQVAIAKAQERRRAPLISYERALIALHSQLELAGDARDCKLRSDQWYTSFYHIAERYLNTSSTIASMRDGLTKPEQKAAAASVLDYVAKERKEAAQRGDAWCEKVAGLEAVSRFDRVVAGGDAALIGWR